MLTLDREGSCIPGCDAYPVNLGSSNYKVVCSEYSEPSNSVTSEAILYQWNNPTPVTIGNSCTVSCKNSKTKLPNEMENFSITCIETGKWDMATLPECVSVCEIPSVIPEETSIGLSDNDIVWSCTDGTYMGSVCTKSCPTGFKLKKVARKSIECKMKRGTAAWKGFVSNCVQI